jgi:hypothetical protein
MKIFKVIEGGVRKRERTVMPDVYADPHDDAKVREYMSELMSHGTEIFDSYDIEPKSIPQDEIEDAMSAIRDEIRSFTNREPRTYDYYLRLYDLLSHVIIHAHEVPTPAFTTNVLALLELADIVGVPAE